MRAYEGSSAGEEYRCVAHKRTRWLLIVNQAELAEMVLAGTVRRDPLGATKFFESWYATTELRPNLWVCAGPEHCYAKDTA